MSFPPVAEQLALLERGVVDFHVRAELEERLETSRATGKPPRVKAGFDPTRPDLHLGRTVLLQKWIASTRGSRSSVSRRASAVRVHHA